MPPASLATLLLSLSWSSPAFTVPPLPSLERTISTDSGLIHLHIIVTIKSLETPPLPLLCYWVLIHPTSYLNRNTVFLWGRDLRLDKKTRTPLWCWYVYHTHNTDFTHYTEGWFSTIHQCWRFKFYKLCFIGCAVDLTDVLDASWPKACHFAFLVGWSFLSQHFQYDNNHCWAWLS